MNKTQKTLKQKVTFSGIGVHTGSKTTMTFHPAPADYGIQFIRVDLEGNPVIKADVSNVVNTARGTILGVEGARVHTVEHVMAALWAYGITNLKIEVDAEEPPVGDGSSLPFVKMIKDAGIVDQECDATVFKITEPLTVTEGDASITVLPYDGLKVSYTLSYSHPLVNTQFLSIDLDKKVFNDEIAGCRTFCFYREIETLMDNGLIKGGSLDNAVVVGDEAILCKEKLRYEDEFVRHKILDLVGDLYLLGIRLEGHMIALKSGHSLNVKLANTIRSKFGNPALKPKAKKSMSLADIKGVLPHRYPFLMVDKIVHMDEDGASGIKNVTANEEYFNGHFPDQPIMPGVLQIEAMAQVVGASYLGQEKLPPRTKPILLSVERAKFRRPVYPGDQLIIEVRYGKFRTSMGKATGWIKVGDEVVSEAEMCFALMEFSK